MHAILLLQLLTIKSPMAVASAKVAKTVRWNETLGWAAIAGADCLKLKWWCLILFVFSTSIANSYAMMSRNQYRQV